MKNQKNDRNFNEGNFRHHLAHFTGTEKHHPHILGYALTDGAKYVADQCQAYWLMDVIASYCNHKNLSTEEYQRWILTVDLQNSSGTVECWTGDMNKPTISQEIPYTDFPLEEITLYCYNKVILLPREN